MMLRLVLALMLLALPAKAEMVIRNVTSPGGIHAWLVEDRSIPFVALEIRFRGGANLDPAGKRGVTNLMTALIEEGTGDLDSQGFAAARDALAAEFSFDAGSDALSVSARMLTENRDAAADLLRQALTAPRFDTLSIERVRGQVLSNISANDEDPEKLAARAFDAMAWGEHPYGSDPDGTAQSVAALTRDDILAAHRATLAHDRIYVAASGDIGATDLGLLLDTLLGGLPATGAPLPPKGTWGMTGGVTVKDYPVPQSVVLFGHEGIRRNDPDFFAAFLLNEVLGGGRFSARLMTEVREKRGLTYGIGTWIAPLDLGEWIGGQFSSDNTKVAEAIGIVRAEWTRAATGGITAEELATAKTYLTGSYPLRFDGNGAIANILVGMQMEGLPIDYPVSRNAKIEAVTLADVARVAKRVLTPEALHFVVVGQPVGLDSGP